MSQSGDKPPLTTAQWTGGSCALVVFGLVILIPSGLCTASMGIASVTAMFSRYGGIEAALTGLMTTLLLGGPFVALGIFLIRTGSRERRPK